MEKKNNTSENFMPSHNKKNIESAQSIIKQGIDINKIGIYQDKYFYPFLKGTDTFCRGV